MADKTFKSTAYKRAIDVGKITTAGTDDLVKIWRSVEGDEKAISLADLAVGVISTLSLTTTGTSGNATFIANVLNIPNYTYTHPAYTPVSQTLSGATVLASFSSDAIGSVTAFTTRTLTPANIGAVASTQISGTLNYVAKFTPDGSSLGNSQIFDNETNVGIGTATPSASFRLDVNGGTIIRSTASQFFEVRDQYGTINFMTGGEVSGGIVIGNPTLGSGLGRWISIIQSLSQTSAYGGLRFYAGASGTTNIGYLGILNGELHIQTKQDDISSQLAIRGSSGTLHLGYYTYDTLPTGAAFSTKSSAGNVLIGNTDGTDKLDVNGTTRIRTIDNATGNFLTTSATGVLQQRTAAETRTDIGAQATIAGTLTDTYVATIVAGVPTWAVSTGGGGGIPLPTTEVFTYVATNTFTLASPDPNVIYVSINGQLQREGGLYDWTVSGTTLTISTPLLAGDEISIMYFEASPSATVSRVVTSIAVNTTAGVLALTDYVYFVTGTTTLTLPTAVGNTNRYTVKSISGVTTVDGNGAETIDGATSIGIAVEDSVDLVSNGTEWKVI